MGLLRWIAASGLRVTMTIALVVFVYHAIAELRAINGNSLNFFQRIELTARDVKFAVRGRRPPEVWRVGVAGVDEKALQEFGPLPWSRNVHASLVRALTKHGVGAIAYDMTFEQPSSNAAEAFYARLMEKARTAGVLDAPSQLGKTVTTLEKYAETSKPSRPKKGEARDAETIQQAANETRKLLENLERFQSELDADLKRDRPDEELAAAMRESGRVVLGILAFSKSEVQSLDENSEQLARSLAAISSSTISEMMDVGSDGAEYIYSDAGAAFEGQLYRRYFGVSAPFESLSRATRHFGTINALPDDDGVYRRVALVASVKGTGVLIPTLALKAVEVAVDEGPAQVIGHPQDAAPRGIRIGSHVIETELQAATTIDWYGGFTPDQIPIYSISDLIADRVPADELKGKVLFVAATAAGTHDQRVTPLEPAVPGVYIHATLAQNIFDGRHMTRPLYVVVLELGLFLMIGLVAGLVMARKGVLGQLITSLSMGLGWILIDYFALFGNGLIVYSVLPTMQIFMSLLGVALWRFLVEQRQSRATRQAFSQYLAPAVMEQVLTNPKEYLKLGGRRYEATVLFSDIRGFTTISEALSPEELGKLLNRYMTPMTDIVFGHGGTLDKYIGDAVMAFWGAPLEQSDHALRACFAALEMLKRVVELNKEFESAGLPRIAIGIGLSTGPMTIGNMGSDDHFSYTALGDRVNLGSRLEGQTKDYGVDTIISEACNQQVSSVMLTRELGALRVKGKKEPVRIFELVGPHEEHKARLPFVETFHAGLAAYRERRWDEAIEHFTRARALSGVMGDRTADHYIGWCSEYKDAPPPPGWDGVRVATTK